MRGRETNVYTTMVASLLEKEGEKGKDRLSVFPLFAFPERRTFRKQAPLPRRDRVVATLARKPGKSVLATTCPVSRLTRT